MSFTKFHIHPDVMKGIRAMGFTEPTPVQAQAIPMFTESKDILVSSATGSGKTAAFLIPLMTRLLENPKPGLQILILEPTRELAAQVETHFRDLARFTPLSCAVITGGSSFKAQLDVVNRGAQVIVATPGRLLDHLHSRSFSLTGIHSLVLDEADRMLDMGFAPDLKAILRYLPEQRQTLLFSATMPPQIEQLSHLALKDHLRLDLGTRATPPSSISQMLYPINHQQKDELLLRILKQVEIQSVIVFCRTKVNADYVSSYLRNRGMVVGTLHSDYSQALRTRTLEDFRHKKYQILVATDIASRGLDIKDISHVINYDVPMHPEDYVHRIGRTGRAEATGDAFTIVTPEEERALIAIEQYIGRTLPRAVLPDFPYKVPPRLTSLKSTASTGFRVLRRRIAPSRSALFRKR